MSFNIHDEGLACLAQGAVTVVSLYWIEFSDEPLEFFGNWLSYHCWRRRVYKNSRRCGRLRLRGRGWYQYLRMMGEVSVNRVKNGVLIFPLWYVAWDPR